jgi:CheY-like chemotaxis protein/HPt (histidine-containing phosphotransfer) domain-containing protein
MSDPTAALADTVAGRILVVEDDPVTQRMTLAMLEHLGFHVDVVADGAGAVKATAVTRYQAILMDCQMPVRDGYQATSEIRRLQGPFLRTPIIAVTASATKSDRGRCLAAGMDDHVTKPLSLKTLAAVLARCAPVRSVSTVAASPAEPVPSSGVGLAPSADPARPALDARVVGRLERLGTAAGEDLMGQLAMLFLADAEVRVVALREALAGDDAAAVARSAHTLHGASANIGAAELARLCATLAKDCATGDPVGGEAQVQAVEAELGRVRSALGSIPTR